MKSCIVGIVCLRGWKRPRRWIIPIWVIIGKGIRLIKIVETKVYKPKVRRKRVPRNWSLKYHSRHRTTTTPANRHSWPTPNCQSSKTSKWKRANSKSGSATYHKNKIKTNSLAPLSPVSESSSSNPPTTPPVTTKPSKCWQRSKAWRK